MPSQSSHRLFVQCALGLEELLEGELTELGVESRRAEGGLECRGDLSLLYRISLVSRLAESVRVRLKEFEATKFPELEKELRKLPFRAYLGPGAKARVKVVCHQSKLWHSGAVQERVEKVLRDHVGWTIDRDSDDSQIVHLRLDDNRVQVSLDATGERMHRRGYRTHVEQASLRETLAAAVVRVAVQRLGIPEGEVVLWDPFCGAGTIASEALHGAHGVLPGIKRRHAFSTWRTFDGDAFGQVQGAEITRAKEAAPLPQMRAFCSDISEKAISAATENVAQAGLSESVSLIVGDIEAVVAQIPQGAMIVTNPPYGKRVHEAGAMQKLLRVLQLRQDIKPVVVLAGGASRDAVPKECRALFRTKNGGVPVSAREIRSF